MEGGQEEVCTEPWGPTAPQVQSKAQVEGMLGIEAGETMATQSGRSFIASAKWLALLLQVPEKSMLGVSIRGGMECANP